MNKFFLSNQTVRNLQLWIICLILYPSVFNIILDALSIFGINILKDIPITASIIYRLFDVTTCFIAYRLAYNITSNLATRKVIKYVGIILPLIGLYSVSIIFYGMYHEIAPTTHSLLNSFSFFIKTGTFLYMFGIIVRNNPDCKKAKQAITINVLCQILSLVSVQALPLYTEPTQMTLIGAIIQIIANLVDISTLYLLFTSEIFNGKLNHEPAPKGAYRFWNKYFTWYIITTFGFTFLLVILGL